MGRDWWILITAATKLQLRHPKPRCRAAGQLFYPFVSGDVRLEQKRRVTPSQLPMRAWACKFFRSLQKLETQEGKTTEEEERMESLERPTLRSKVWKSWNILSPETCDREEGGVGVSLMIRTRCNYRATPLTVIDQWGTPLMKTRTRWAPRSQTGKKWKVGIEIPEREGAERMGQILKIKNKKMGF